MVFSSIPFLYFFLPAVLILYFAVPQKFRNTILFLCSLIFYAWGEPVYITIMLFSTVVDYTNGRLIAHFEGCEWKRKTVLVIDIIINLGILMFFKYSDFFISNINSITNSNIALLGLALPIGVSFYTFQTMSYTIDVYRHDAPVQKNIISFGAYVTLFPQLIAGPIVRYKTIAEQLDSRRESFSVFFDGMARFCLGLAKKVLIANNVGALWDLISATPAPELSVISAWIGIIAFALQIYFDFSGYSDMAIGLGKMFGFTFEENFNYPYISKSITEFWRRWHISLGTWFREYVYIPLGGNRKGKAQTYINIFVVWFLTGFWHGASWNFAIWGLYFALILIIEKTFLLKLLEKLPHFVAHIYSIILILLGWVIFAFDSLSKGFAYFKAMIGISSNGFIDASAIYSINSYAVIFIIGIIASLPLCKKLFDKYTGRTRYVLMGILSLISLAVCTIYLVSSAYNPFLYFRF
ncbi:MAG: MBOAT family protein [Ruminococcaceae bacterium]|nr:MBOAT family protein [Oscillospiraceae bacterium]